MSLLKSNEALTINFRLGDITDLSALKSPPLEKASYDIITVCSALVLIPDPWEAMKHWVEYLKPGGRIVVDVPHGKSMLGNKVLGLIGPEFGVTMLGNRRWVVEKASLGRLMEDAGLEADVLETDIFDDIPARTEKGKYDQGWWHESEGATYF